MKLVETELGHFLRTRRARLQPEDVGLVSYGARRVPGLRREELAQLAGVSMTYYTRLEQGHSQQASDEILLAIARALRLDDDETAHLRNLARPANHPRPKVQEPEPAREGARRLVERDERGRRDRDGPAQRRTGLELHGPPAAGRPLRRAQPGLGGDPART